MKKGTILGLAAALAAGAAAVALLGRRNGTEALEEPAAPSAGAGPMDPDKTVAFPLKNKYADYSRGESDPIYRFELETPNGVREAVVDAERYETYYIGDEVVCRETGRELTIV